jgi:ParB family chromosome partitioning protein
VQAQLLEDLKKAEMARDAEHLLDGTGWLPEPIRLRVANPSEALTQGAPRRCRVPHR